MQKIPNPVSVSLDPRQTALVIIDMQNDFANPKGKIYTGPMVGPTIPRIKSLLQKARDLGMKVVYTQAWYDAQDPRFIEGSRGRGRHGGGCMADTWGAEIIKELEMKEGESLVKKASYDCFFGTNMEEVLDKSGFGRFQHPSVHRNRSMNSFNVIITGTVSNVCVEKAVIGFFLRGYEVIVPIDCISAISRYEQEWALLQFSTLYAAKLTTSDMIELTKPRGTAPLIQRRKKSRRL